MNTGCRIMATALCGGSRWMCEEPRLRERVGFGILHLLIKIDPQSMI
jgi:hypothetical protein